MKKYIYVPRDQTVNIGEQLGLGCSGITAQQDVQLRTEIATTSLGEVLARAAKKLEQDTLLDVLVLIDGGGDGPSQPLVDVRLLGQTLQQLHSLLR
jgi:hypothetical protein